MTEAAEYLKQHPQDFSLPASTPPDFKAASQQAAETKRIPGEPPQGNMFGAMSALKKTLDEIQSTPGGDWGGQRDKVVASIAQAVSDVGAGIQVYRDLMAARNSRRGAAAPNQNVQVLTPEQMRGIVLIEGDNLVASGFLAKVHDIEVIVTNLHVLGDNANLTIKNLEGNIIPWQGIAGAVGSDIALLRVAKPTGEPPPLALAADVFKSTKIGDRVVVVGNRLGGGVATQGNGQIKGVGPARVEVDAAFQPGNSGSPIVDISSNEVIGVATYALVVTVQIPSNTSTGSQPQDAGNGTTTGISRETRWFGYRLDSVSKWETIDPNAWRAQMARVKDFRGNSLTLLAVLQGKLAAAQGNDNLREIIDQFAAKVKRIHVTAPRADGTDPLTPVVRDFLHQLGVFAEADVKDFGNGPYYDYFRTTSSWATNVPEQIKFREQLVKAITDAEDNYQLYQSRLLK